ncbi:hypothetical protein J6590_042885 [Homalodisca vitripennis]|nr:hypothetical protein J6590_042885 [Homalodisca vitripennis]
MLIHGTDCTWRYTTSFELRRRYTTYGGAIPSTREVRLCPAAFYKICWLRGVRYGETLSVALTVPTSIRPPSSFGDMIVVLK